MNSVNMLEAKTQLSKRVERIESGQDEEIVIARNGRPAARLVPIARNPPGKRIGLLKGKFKAPSRQQLDTHIADLERMFQGE